MLLKKHLLILRDIATPTKWNECLTFFASTKYGSNYYLKGVVRRSSLIAYKRFLKVKLLTT